MAITELGVIQYRGLSTDDKPTGKDGDRFTATDTGKVFVKQEAAWVEEENRAGGSTFTVSGAEVFSGTSPTSWTDLDLSGTIGANSALVILAISSGVDMNALAVRKNGDTDEYYNVAVEANAYGCAIAHHDADAVLVLICVTDTAGVIEWITESAQTASIKLLAYIA